MAAQGPVPVSVRTPDLVRAGLVAMLLPYADRVRVLPADSLDAARNQTPPEVEIFDPWGSGPTRRTCGDAFLVALVHDDDPHTARLAHHFGAHRVLALSAGAEQVVSTVEDARTPRCSTTREPCLLSHREWDVLQRICLGLSNAEIAADLYVSINSVKTYIREAYRKIGVTSRTQAVLWGLGRGLDEC